MPGPYASVSAVLQNFADCIGQEATDLHPRFGRLAHQAVRQGWHDLVTAIGKNPGYTAAHLDRADQRHDWNVQQATFRMGTGLAGGYGDFQRQGFESLDLRATLADPGIVLTEGGVPIPVEPGDNPAVDYASGTLARATELDEDYDAKFGDGGWLRPPG